MNQTQLMAIGPFVGIGLVAGIVIGVVVSNIGLGAALGLIFGAGIGVVGTRGGAE
jgi:hypothetical protein